MLPAADDEHDDGGGGSGGGGVLYVSDRGGKGGAVHFRPGLPAQGGCKFKTTNSDASLVHFRRS